MTTSTPVNGNAGTAPALSCLAGAAAPAEVLQDWSRLEALPPRALDGLWDLLGPSLAGVDPGLERKAEAFCRLYDIPPDDLRASLRVCRFVLLRAGSVSLPAERVAQDVRSLARGESSPAAQMLISRYDSAKEIVRQGLVEQALLDHGKVLTGVDVRVDRISGSDRAAGLDQPVVLLTLRTREGDRNERTTVYMTPEAFSRIKEAWSRVDALLGNGNKETSHVG